MSEGIKYPLQLLFATLFAMGVGWFLGYIILTKEREMQPKGPNVGRIILSHDSSTEVGLVSYTVVEPGAVRWDTLYTTNDTAWLPYNGGLFVNYGRTDSLDKRRDSLFSLITTSNITSSGSGLIITGSGGSGWVSSTPANGFTTRSTLKCPLISAGKGVIIQGDGTEKSPYKISVDPYYVDSVAFRYGTAVHIPIARGRIQADSFMRLHKPRLVIFDTLVQDTFQIESISQ